MTPMLLRKDVEQMTCKYSFRRAKRPLAKGLAQATTSTQARTTRLTDKSDMRREGPRPLPLGGPVSLQMVFAAILLHELDRLCERHMPLRTARRVKSSFLYTCGDLIPIGARCQTLDGPGPPAFTDEATHVLH